MRHLGFFLRQEPHDLGQIEVVITQRDVDLVQQHHPNRGIADQLFRLLPPFLRHLDIAGLVLGFPGEALAHRVKLAQIAEIALQQPPLAGIPGPLDELHHGAGHPMRDAAQDHAEPGGGLALARSGMHDDQPLLTLLLRHDLVARGLLLGHLLRMAIFVGKRCVGHLASSSCLTKGSVMEQVRSRAGSCLRTGEEGMRQALRPITGGKPQAQPPPRP